MESSENQIIGAIKIKDGLFIGDEFASQDLEFIVTNKVTHIINCAAKEVSNSWESIGVSYLSFPWNESDDQIIFDEQNEIVQEIFRFIEETTITGESCLVHSVRGQSRSCCVLAAYFMRKYRWSLYKTLEYLNSRRPDLEIRASFFHQLNDLENRLAKLGLGAKSSNWNELGDHSFVDSDELVVRNTFLNSKNLPLSDIYNNQNYYLNKNVKPKIFWVDENGKNGSNLAVFFQEKEKNEVVPTANGYKMNSNYIKSILKGSNKVFSKQAKLANERNEKKNPVVVFGPYLKMNKSSKSLIDENSFKNINYEEKKPATPHPNQQWSKPPISNKEILNRSSLLPEQSKIESNVSTKDNVSLIKSSNNSMSRSSSLKVINKDDSKENINENHERNNDKKYNEILNANNFGGNANNGTKEIIIPNGNRVIHVTVNNFVNSPTINNTINKFNCQPKPNNSEKISNSNSSNYYPLSKNNEKNQSFQRNSSKNSDDNIKPQNPYENYLETKNLYKFDINKEKDKNTSNSSFLSEFKENKKKILSRREHDSVSPIPIRGKSSISPPKDSKDKKPKVMNESVYSKTLLKRFQNSLKEKTFENTYLKVLKEQNSFNKQLDQENDVSPMRKVYDKSFPSKIKQSEQMQNEQQGNINSMKSSSNRISYTLNARKAAISPLHNNTNVNNLIHSVTNYQISTKNSNNPSSNSNLNYSGLGNMSNNNKNAPIRPIHERKDFTSTLVPNKQIFMTNDGSNEHFSSQNFEIKSKNISDLNPLNRPGSAPFRYYSPSSKMVVKNVQRSITPLSSNNENNQVKPRLRSSSPSSNLTQNQNHNSINTSLQNNLFVYSYNSTSFQNKPKWKF